MIRLKIKDIIVQQLEDSGRHIARITVNGKTGTRHVRLNNSYPRLKDWLSNGHPFPNNPNSPLFCGIGKKNTGRRLSTHAINAMYDRYKKQAFPALLEDNSRVPEEDKRKIRDLLKKKWNPYVRRHTTATEISKVLKDPVLIDQYMGWSHKGNTRQKYQHYYSDDAFDAVLTIADGLISPNNNISRTKDQKSPLKPVQCPNCDESNKPESKFCVKCKFVLSFDAFNETLQEREKTRKESEEYKKRFEELEARQKQLELDSQTRQQQEIQQMKEALDKTQDQVGLLLQMLTNVNQEEAASTGSKKDFLLHKLGILTNGKIGEDPNNPGFVVEPSNFSSIPCVICKMIEKEEDEKKK